MEYVKLGEIGKIVTGNTPSKKEKKYYSENYIDFVKPTNFKNNEITYINKGEEFLSLEGMQIGRVAGSNSVLITCIGNIGNIGLLNKKVCFNQQINSIEVDSSKVFKEYVAYALQSIVPVLRHNANKAVVPILNKSQLEKIKIPICNLEKQKKVIDKLNIVRIIIKRREEQLKLLEDLNKSLFYEMFGDPIRNEKGWEVKKLKNISYVNDKKKILTPKEKYWLLNLEEIEAGSGRIILKKRIKYEDLPSSISYFDKNWILYSKLRPYLNKVVLSDEEGFCTSELIALRPNLEYLTDVFLWKYLMNNTILEYLKIHVSGAKMPRVVMEDFKNLKVVIPPLELQQKFSERIRDIDKLKFEIEQSLKETENLYNSLMQKFFK